MKEPQVLHGTWSELSRLAPELGDRQVTLVIPGDDDIPGTRRSGTPEVVDTEERLEEMLLEGLVAPGIEMSDANWDRIIDRFDHIDDKRSSDAGE